MTEFERFQRIRLKEINKMVGQRPNQPGQTTQLITIQLLMVEKQAIEHFLKPEYAVDSPAKCICHPKPKVFYPHDMCGAVISS